MKQGLKQSPWWFCWLGAVLLVAGCRNSPEREWPGWRGPDGLGLADGPLPVTWDGDGVGDGSGIRWRTELPGVGNSSPVAAGGRIFLTTAVEPSASGEAQRSVVALDLDSGDLLWRTPVLSAPRETTHRFNTVAAPTPVTDGESVFVYFGSVLARLDRDGELIWVREIDPRYSELSHYGASSSPVLTDEAVIVTQDREYATTDDPGWIAAFDRATGEPLWRTEWSNTCCSYSTPLVVRRGGRGEIVFAHSGRVAAYAADSGERLWDHGYPIHQMVGSPVIEGDVLGVSGGAHHVRHTVFLRLIGTGSETRTEVLWEDGRLVPQVSSPVLYDGLFFTVTDQGVLACRDPQTGEVLWKHRLSRHHNRASLIAGDGKVYVASSTGVVSVVAAAPEFELLAENELGEELSNASPAVAGECLLLRTRTALVCIQRPVE
jgi:outer membrane protein assembly factor BamB